MAVTRWFGMSRDERIKETLTKEAEEVPLPRSTCSSPQTRAPNHTQNGSCKRSAKPFALAVRGILRAQALADTSNTYVSEADLTGLTQSISATLVSMKTYEAIAKRLFLAFGQPKEASDVDISDIDRSAFPLSRLPDIFVHWQIPEQNAPLFEALLRKQPAFWDMRVMPSSIDWPNFRDVLIKVLRRMRNKYCNVKFEKADFVTQNTRKVEDEYTLGGPCGHGSYGECTWVTHILSKRRRVCKKIMKADIQIPNEERVSELEKMKCLDHPNILRVFEWFESPDAFCMIVEAATGGDLQHLLSSQTTLTGLRGLEEALVQKVCRQAALGLVYIHAQCMVHRDIKPSNLLLATPNLEQLHLLVADFGVTEFVFDLATPEVAGSPYYVAPEVFLKKVTPRTDVWALGIVVYKLLSGDVPFHGNNVMAQFVLVMTKDVNYEPVRMAKATDQAIDFLVCTLVKEEVGRLDASDILQHPWILEGGGENTDIGRKSLRELRKIRTSIESYIGGGHLTKVAMSCIASQVDHSQITELSHMFEQLDTDHDGTLSPDELEKGLVKLGVEQEAVQFIASALDTNCNGSVEYSEFISGLLSVQRQLVEKALDNVFHIFDVDHSNSLSLDELRLALSGDGPLVSLLPDGETIEALLEKMDSSHDGRVSCHEFKTFVLHQLYGKPQNQDDSVTGEIPDTNLGVSDGQELIGTIFCRLGALFGREKEECQAWADRLSEQHWLLTANDLKELRACDWARLKLPLKFQCTLRKFLEGHSFQSIASSLRARQSLAALGNPPGTPSCSTTPKFSTPTSSSPSVSYRVVRPRPSALKESFGRIVRKRSRV